MDFLEGSSEIWELKKARKEIIFTSASWKEAFFLQAIASLT